MRIPGLVGALFIGLLIVATTAHAQTPPPRDITGYWKFRDTGEVLEFYACGALRCARLAALAPGERQTQDSQNPVVALRARPLCNLTVIEGLRASPPAKWTHGAAYSPEDGNVYDVRVDLVAESVANLRATLRGMPLLGTTYKLEKVATPTQCR